MRKFVSILPAAAWCAALALAGCSSNTPTTQVIYGRVDRSGQPAINAGIIPSADTMETFNAGSPASDVNTWTRDFKARVDTLRNSARALGPEDDPGITDSAVVAQLLPDVITLDFGLAVKYPNGRRPEDDVMDYDLGRLLNRGDTQHGGPGVPDGVGANDKAFLPAFPYLAEPHMTAP